MVTGFFCSGGIPAAGNHESAFPVKRTVREAPIGGTVYHRERLADTACYGHIMLTFCESGASVLMHATPVRLGCCPITGNNPRRLNPTT
jgi:hypothetical protein